MAVAPDAAETLRPIIAPVVEQAGLVLEDLAVRTPAGGTELEVVVDLPETETGSADLDAIAEASRAVSEALDASAETDRALGTAPYQLMVATPGVDRPLTRLRHVRRALGRLLRIRRHDGTEIVGRLLEVTDPDLLTVRPEPEPGTKPTGRRRPAEPIRIPFGEIDRAQVLVELSPPEPPAAADGPSEQDQTTTNQEG